MSSKAGFICSVSLSLWFSLFFFFHKCLCFHSLVEKNLYFFEWNIGQKNDCSRALLSKNVKTLPHKSKKHLVSADFVKVLWTEMRIYYPPVSAAQSREQSREDGGHDDRRWNRKCFKVLQILQVCRLRLASTSLSSSLLSRREKKLSSFVPAHVAMGGGGLFSTLRGKSSRQAALEQNLLEEYRKIGASAGSPPEPKRLLQQYLHTCHTLPYYG